MNSYLYQIKKILSSQTSNQEIAKQHTLKLIIIILLLLLLGMGIYIPIKAHRISEINHNNEIHLHDQISKLMEQKVSTQIMLDECRMDLADLKRAQPNVVKTIEGNHKSR